MTEIISDADRLLADLVIAEHQTFWSKFTAFSALNLGLIVLALGRADGSLVIPIIGATLSVLWFLVQYLSYHYVCYYGVKFETVVTKLGIRPSRVEFWAGFVRPTLVAVIVSMVVFCFWVERIINVIHNF